MQLGTNAVSVASAQKRPGQLWTHVRLEGVLLTTPNLGCVMLLAKLLPIGVATLVWCLMLALPSVALDRTREVFAAVCLTSLSVVI